MRPVQFTIAPLSTGIAASTTGHIMTVVVLAVVLVLIMVVVVVSAVVMLVLLSVLLSPLLLSVLVLIAVVDMVMLVLAMVVLVLAMIVLVVAMVVLVLAMVVLVLAMVVLVLAMVVLVLMPVLVLVLTPFGQNALPLSKFRLHTNGIFKLQLRSFQAAAITVLACPIEIQYSWSRKLLGSNDPPAKLPIHKQSSFCVQQPFMPDDCAHPAYPPALAG